MEMVLLLLGVFGLAALLGVFDDSDDDGAAPDIELDGLEPTGQHFAVVNDTHERWGDHPHKKCGIPLAFLTN